MSRSLTEQLPALKAEFAPRYDIGTMRTHAGISLIAVRIGSGDGPLVIVTPDPNELRRYLSGY